MAIRPHKTWLDFPARYFEFLDSFERGEEIVLEGNWGKLMGERTQLYRFFKKFERGEELAGGENHEIFKKYQDIAARVSLAIRPTKAGVDEPARLRFEENPCEKTFRETRREEQEKKEKELEGKELVEVGKEDWEKWMGRGVVKD